MTLGSSPSTSATAPPSPPLRTNGSVERPALASEALLAGLDALACATLALLAAFVVGAFDPLHFVLSSTARAALVLPFTLVGPLGAGIERGRAPALVRALAALGAAVGAFAGAWWLDGERGTTFLLVRAGVPLALGPLLTKAGARLHRPEEDWRADARLRPPEATPAFAFKVARARLPLAVRVLFLPVAVALVPFAIVGLVLIRCYQLAVSRFLPPQCRFEPSCSRYGFQAIFKLGALKGFLLTAFRLGRCHPFCRAGHDPVPDPEGHAG